MGLALRRREREKLMATLREQSGEARGYRRARMVLLAGLDAARANEEAEVDDRVRLTRLGKSSWGLSVKRHTGRWERTPFAGSVEEMVEVMHTLMQHLVAP